MGKKLAMMVIFWIVVLAVLSGVAGGHPTLAHSMALSPATVTDSPTPVASYLPFLTFQPTWQPAGLAGHTVRVLLGDESTTYAGVEPGGVYQASGCTLAWQTAGLATQSVFALAQRADGPLYAGTFGAGVFRSTDSGHVWQPVNNGLGDPRIYGLAAHAAQPIVLAAGFDHGIYRTTNGGVSWQRSAPNDLNELNAVLFDPGVSSIAYAGTYRRGLYRSNNTGATFAPANTGLPAQPSVWAIAAVRASGVTTVTIGTSSGVFRSTNGGAGWHPAGLSGHEVRALTNDPHDAGHWFAGTRGGAVWETTDTGATWRNIGHGLPADRAVYALRLLPAPCGLLLAGTANGAFQRPVWLHAAPQLSGLHGGE